MGVFPVKNWQQSYFEDSFNAHPDDKSPLDPYYWLLYTQKNTILVLTAINPVVDILSLKKANMHHYGSKEWSTSFSIP